MAEIQQSTNAADLTQRFIEFVMMQAQQAALCLGQIAHPSTGKAEVNLEAARMFIDQLEIIREKTRGNLTKDEEKILTSVLSELQLSFVHVAQGSGDTSLGHDEKGDHGDPVFHPEEPKGDSPVSPAAEPTSAASEEEGKKKFTKSYGA